MAKTFLMALFLTFFLVLFTVQIVPSTPEHLFVIAGQSNAAGVAHIPEDQPQNPRAFKFDIQLNSWVILSEPTTPPYKYSFGTSFALKLLSLTSEDYTVGLIPCAVSGSSVQSWQTGKSNYDKCVNLVRNVLNNFPEAKLEGLIFYQGETNAKTSEAAKRWPDLFVSFYQAFRSDVGYKNLPVLYVQIGPHGKGRPGWGTLQSLQKQLALSGKKNLVMVSAKDLTLIPGNNLHIDTTSQDILGRRLAMKFFENFYPPISAQGDEQ